MQYKTLKLPSNYVKAIKLYLEDMKSPMSVKEFVMNLVAVNINSKYFTDTREVKEKQPTDKRQLKLL